jgi:uncharacterized protein (TIGR02145 family)/uncharacterized repeat protein (TIGR02543 family)
VAVTANYDFVEYTVKVTSAGTGASGGGAYRSGAKVTVKAGTPPAGTQFKEWTTVPADLSVNYPTWSEATFTMPTKDVTVTAVFEGIYTITADVTPVGGGTVSRNPDKTGYTSGEQVTVTATAASGYAFKGWSGASTSTGSSITVTMDGNKTLTANFMETGPVTDSRDGKTYTTTVIGGKRWMAQNLNYAPTVGNSWCYSGSAANCNTYGRLYDWNTAMAGAVSSSANPSGVQGVCPAGWHLPSSAEWDALVSAVGGNPGAGTKLKSTSGWNNKSDGTSGNGTNDYGFSALPGGSRTSVGDFYSAGNYGNWWTATEYNADYAYNRGMGYDNDNVYSGNYGKSYAWSVRCVAD